MTESAEVLINYPEASELAVIHKRHGDERCNRDDMKNRAVVDVTTAAALIDTGEARYCEICHPDAA